APAIVLPQAEYPDDLLAVQLSDYASTMTFPQVPKHAALKDVSADDLKFWRGGNLVSDHEIVRPTSGGCRPIVVSGCASGLSHAPLLELPRGKGTFLLCQLRLMEKLGVEPAARQILQNALNYLATFTPETRQTLVASDSPDFKQLLAGLNLRFTDVTGKLAQTELPPQGLLILAGDVDEVVAQQKKIRTYLESGGRALFLNLKPQTFEKLGGIFPKDVALQAQRAGVVAINRDDPLTCGWTRESLYWLGKHEGPGYAHTPLADGVADYALSSHKTGPIVLSLKATDMSIEGQLVRANGDHVDMFTNGAVSSKIEIAEGGRYGIAVSAKGTPMENVWPMMEVAVDGEPVNMISVPSPDWMTVSAPCDLQKGSHTVKVSYINDASKPGEDRNMFVKQVDIVRMPTGSEGYVALTRPAFVARFDAGRGCAVLDEIAWSTEMRNTQKALQYAQGLLTALGADFEETWSYCVGPNDLVEDKKMAHFSRSAEQVCLATNGYVTTRLTFATGGKYTFELVASGSPVQNIYPIVDVQLDGKLVSTIELKSDASRTYPLTTEVSPGEHEIKLVYTNDEYRPPEDRNLYIQKLRVRPAVQGP
ncbi:MAG: carbohydrate-binding domain-containing protein, partial [Planctomycetota bacterium]